MSRRFGSFSTLCLLAFMATFCLLFSRLNAGPSIIAIPLSQNTPFLKFQLTDLDLTKFDLTTDKIKFDLDYQNIQINNWKPDDDDSIASPITTSLVVKTAENNYVSKPHPANSIEDKTTTSTHPMGIISWTDEISFPEAEEEETAVAVTVDFVLPINAIVSESTSLTLKVQIGGDKYQFEVPTVINIAPNFAHFDIQFEGESKTEKAVTKFVFTEVPDGSFKDFIQISFNSTVNDKSTVNPQWVWSPGSEKQCKFLEIDQEFTAQILKTESYQQLRIDYFEFEAKTLTITCPGLSYSLAEGAIALKWPMNGIVSTSVSTTSFTSAAWDADVTPEPERVVFDFDEYVVPYVKQSEFFEIVTQAMPLDHGRVFDVELTFPTITMHSINSKHHIITTITKEDGTVVKKEFKFTYENALGSTTVPGVNFGESDEDFTDKTKPTMRILIHSDDLLAKTQYAFSLKTPTAIISPPGDMSTADAALTLSTFSTLTYQRLIPHENWKRAFRIALLDVQTSLDRPYKLTLNDTSLTPSSLFCPNQAPVNECDAGEYGKVKTTLDISNDVNSLTLEFDKTKEIAQHTVLVIECETISICFTPGSDAVKYSTNYALGPVQGTADITQVFMSGWTVAPPRDDLPVEIRDFNTKIAPFGEYTQEFIATIKNIPVTDGNHFDLYFTLNGVDIFPLKFLSGVYYRLTAKACVETVCKETQFDSVHLEQGELDFAFPTMDGDVTSYDVVLELAATHFANEISFDFEFISETHVFKPAKPATATRTKPITIADIKSRYATRTVQQPDEYIFEFTFPLLSTEIVGGSSWTLYANNTYDKFSPEPLHKFFLHFDETKDCQFINTSTWKPFFDVSPQVSADGALVTLTLPQSAHIAVGLGVKITCPGVSFNAYNDNIKDYSIAWVFEGTAPNNNNNNNNNNNTNNNGLVAITSWLGKPASGPQPAPDPTPGPDPEPEPSTKEWPFKVDINYASTYQPSMHVSFTNLPTDAGDKFQLSLTPVGIVFSNAQHSLGRGHHWVAITKTSGETLINHGYFTTPDGVVSNAITFSMPQDKTVKVVGMELTLSILTSEVKDKFNFDSFSLAVGQKKWVFAPDSKKTFGLTPSFVKSDQIEIHYTSSGKSLKKNDPNRKYTRHFAISIPASSTDFIKYPFTFGTSASVPFVENTPVFYNTIIGSKCLVRQSIEASSKVYGNIIPTPDFFAQSLTFDLSSLADKIPIEGGNTKPFVIDCSKQWLLRLPGQYHAIQTAFQFDSSEAHFVREETPLLVHSWMNQEMSKSDDSYPNEGMSGFAKFCLVVFILALIGGLGYAAYKYGLPYVQNRRTVQPQYSNYRNNDNSEGAVLLGEIN